MNKIFLISILAITLTSCGDEDSSKNSSNSKSAPVKRVTNSYLTKFMDQETVCDAISIETVQKLFNATNEIKATSSGYASKYNNSVTCNYSWDRVDAEEREKNYMNNMMQSMQGKAEKLPMRQRVSEHTFSIRLEEFKGQPDQFMPRKLSEKELENQISEAKKRAAKRLTDEQKKVAGDMANTMMEKLLRQNNNNVKIDDVGDSAYWTAIAGGSLEVLSGNVKMSISPMIGETLKEDMKNANTIANTIIQ